MVCSSVGQLTISDVMSGGIQVTRNMMSDVIQQGSLVTKLSLGGRRGQRFKKRGIIIHKDDTGIVLFFIGRNLLFFITN